MTDANEWTGRVGSAWAEEWRRTDRSFGPLTDRLLDPPAIEPYTDALDIGCGAGEVTQRLAVLRPQARVVGIDISSELLDAARGRCAKLANVRLVQRDAARWTGDGEARPDLLVSRHGVMFFADPVAAFAHLRAAVAPGAQLRFSCFRSRADNAWAMALMSALPPQPAPDPHAPGPFAFADAERVTAILAEAGWRDIGFAAVDYPMIVGVGEDGGEGAMEDALSYLQRIGPAARAIAELPGHERTAVRERLRSALLPHQTADGISLPAAAWIVTGRAP